MLRAEEFVERARGLGYDWYAGVPCSILTPFINYAIGDSGLSYVSSANEGDALACAAGAFVGGRRPVVMMQNSGLGNAVNPLASLAYVFRIPALLIVTLRGDPAHEDEPQHELMGTITGGLLEQLSVPWEYFPSESGAVGSALERAQAHFEREERPYAFVMRKGTIAPHTLAAGKRAVPLRSHAKPVTERTRDPETRHSRIEALRRVIELTPEHNSIVVATTGYTGRELFALADRANHFYVVGSMGCASSLGLGLSMVRPDLKVVVIDGDGAALMRMGNFATIGAYGGSNLVHVVLDNEVHDSTGGQSTVSAGVSFATVAAGCGYAMAVEGDELRCLDDVLKAKAAAGPRFVRLRIRPGTADNLPRPTLSPHAVSRRLMAHIGTGSISPNGFPS
ncbi:MAG: phosphonopyruvate decarboxylase [Betaproteobacteria bacterium]|nr:phosphonopyruvate decarboxylase [Betaproteobacteria bacterium]